MFEVGVGLLPLLLGWRCFKRESNARAALGLLLILSGAALIAALKRLLVTGEAG